MAWVASDGGAVPHASGPADLLAKLKTFILTAGWESVATVSGTEYVKSTANNIYVGFRPYDDGVGDIHALYLQGLTGYSAGPDFNSQLGAIVSFAPYLPLALTTMPYWFFCSSRRIVIVVKIGSVYVSAYLGWILPYGTPSEMPYPICIGGSNRLDASNTTPERFSSTNPRSSAFAIQPQLGSETQGSIALRDNNGTWARFCQDVNRSNALYSYFDGNGQFPYCEQYVDEWLGFTNFRPAASGEYMLLPIILFQENGSTPNIFGELDGVFALTGFSQTSENTVTIAGVQYLVVGNVFRTSTNDFFAVRLT